MSGLEHESQDVGTQTSVSLPVVSGDGVEPAIRTHGLTSDDQAAINALPASSALLIMQRGANAGARFLLDSEQVNVGRHPQSDIFLDDVTVSRKHATFSLEDGSFVVRDSGSLNGTYVNRTLIDSWALRTGDEVQIGKFRMTFHASPIDEPGGAGNGAGVGSGSGDIA